MSYVRPIPETGPAPCRGTADDAPRLAGGWLRWRRAGTRGRGMAETQVAAADVTGPLRAALDAPRGPLLGLSMDRPRIMGIVNVTPDSFSDGGRFATPDAAVAHAWALVAAGADILDIGGESTRPGATEVPAADEIGRVVPVIEALRAAGVATPISVDTRKAAVARAALDAGADMVNDVSALSFDADMAATLAAAEVPVCLMHARGLPADMQDDPRYDDVLCDVFDMLSARRDAALAAGIAAARIVVDPGIGFGKTQAHNLTLVRGLSMLHGLGQPILFGASRKRFIGTIGGAAEAQARGPGSVAVALAAVAQGAQILRVHDVAETRQALRLWWALHIDDDSHEGHGT